MDEDRTQRASAEIAGHAFVAVQNAFIVGDEGKKGGEGVMFGGYEWKNLLELADEVVDLEVVVGMGLVLLGRWCRLFGRFRRWAPLSFRRIGGVVRWVQRRGAHVVHYG